jgi:hypothetical protein
MFFCAVVSDEIDRVIEFFPMRRQAETMVAEALRDEPDWRGILRVEKIEFRTGMANLTPRWLSPPPPSPSSPERPLT